MKTMVMNFARPVPRRARPHVCLAAVMGTLLLVPLAGRAADPVVSNVTAVQRAGTKLVDITYDVADADESQLEIAVEISSDGGASYVVPATALSQGATANSFPTVTFPPATTSLTGRTIVWDAGVDFNQQFNSQMIVRVIATDGPAPPGMVPVPAGAFTMGDSTNAGLSNEDPTHSVTISSFYMDRHEVTEALWDSVRAWALAHGYTLAGIPDRGAGKGPKHPAHGINWYTAVKWCNARSEMEGLTPVYYTDGTQTTVYRTNVVDLQESFVNWGADGYRLPTEAEWEKASRGGLAGKNYPWGGQQVTASQDITGCNANYLSSGDPFEAVHPQTSPAGHFGPNCFGLSDMAGNVFEWCWDAYNSLWYFDGGATAPDTRGPAVVGTPDRVFRGGAHTVSGGFLRCSYRGFSAPNNSGTNIGFRCVRDL